jgi:tryptophan synthase beta chain
MRFNPETKDMPDKWYNIIPDLEFALSPAMGSSGYPLSQHDMASLSPDPIIEQELERNKRDIPIPQEIRKLYSEWRPTPLFRAERLERTLDTPARIFYKYEGGSPSGSYEFNTAIAQAFYASRDDTKSIITATGDGDWGASLAIACNYFNIECKVYMVRSSYDQREHGRYIMEILGAEVIPSPSEFTGTGKGVLSKEPNSPGSLGIALGEAFEDAMGREDTMFAWGTVMNHVILHQTVIGIETQNQMKRAGFQPDICIGAVAGGSGFGGLVFPFYQEIQRGMQAIAVETAAAPSLSKGRYAYDYADSGRLGPMLQMYTLGNSYIPPGISAGGMRYHGISPLVSALYREKQIKAQSYTQRQAFEAGITFARSEGFVPSPESSYTIKAVIDQALAYKEKKERKNILFLLSTNSNLDIATFKDFLEGAVEDKYIMEEQVEDALDKLPQIATD